MVLATTISGETLPDDSIPDRPMQGSITQTEFTILAHALAGAVAQQCGIRAVAIKGPALHRQGLRSREVSADADVWVDPRHTTDLVEALKRCGWRARLGERVAAGYPHSISMIHDDWACDIDVHFRFPGIGLPDTEAFEHLWEHSDQMDFAGVACQVANPAFNAVISALHSLRPTTENGLTDSRLGSELPELVDRTPHLATEIAQLAIDLKCAAAIEEFLIQIAPDIKIEGQAVAPDWKLASDETTPLGLWLHSLRRASMRQRLRIIARLVWPTPAELGTLSSDRRTIRKLRIDRIRRGLRLLPTTWRQRRTHRRHG